MSDGGVPAWWPTLRDVPAVMGLGDWQAFDRLLGGLRPRPSRVLILGMAPDLVAAWLAFLPRARFLRLSNVAAKPHPRLIDFSGDICDRASLETLLTAAASQRFHAVIDDGSHRIDDVWTAFDRLFATCLESGGVYAMQSWGVSYIPGFPEGARAKLTVRPRAVKLGVQPASHTHGMAGLIKALIDHVPVNDLLSNGADPSSLAPIRSVTVLPNVVGIERW